MKTAMLPPENSVGDAGRERMATPSSISDASATGTAVGAGARFGGSVKEKHLRIAEHAGLDADGVARARALGAALRLGFSLSAGREDILHATWLKRDGERLILHLPEAGVTYSGDALASLHAALASGLGLKPRVEFAD